MNGETYVGELERNLPFGIGTLYLSEGSISKGNYDDKTLQEGKFTHFTGLTFKGTFIRERFFKGKIKFIDGDVLDG